MDIINIELLSHPINWLTVWLMVAILAIALHLIFTHVKATTVPSTPAV